LARIWFLFSMAVAMYGFGTLWYGSSHDSAQAMLAVRLCYAFGVLWIASLYHHFVVTFLEKGNRKIVIFNYATSFIFSILMFTPYMFPYNRWVFNSVYYPVIGKIYPVFFIWWMALVFYSHFLLVRAYFKVESIKKEQIKYFFLATALGYT